MAEINKNIPEKVIKIEDLTKEDLRLIELKKENSKDELIELLIKEEEKVKKHKKEKGILRKELENLKINLEEEHTINAENKTYLESLNQTCQKTEKRLQQEGSTLHTVIETVGDSLNQLETTIRFIRKAVQLDLLKGNDKNE